MQRCPVCGSTTIRRSTDLLRAGFPGSGVVASGRVPALRCKRCDETFVTLDHMQAFELAVSRELGARGVCSGETFRFMRKVIGLRAVDLAGYLDVTPETVSHWETGKAPVPRAAFAVLAALVDDEAEGRTATRSRLERLASPGPRPKVLRPRLDLSGPPRVRSAGDPRASPAGAVRPGAARGRRSPPATTARHRRRGGSSRRSPGAAPRARRPRLDSPRPP